LRRREFLIDMQALVVPLALVSLMRFIGFEPMKLLDA